MKPRPFLAGLVLLFVSYAVAQPPATTSRPSPSKEAGDSADAFKTIFDGTTLDGWRVMPEEAASDWFVRDGAIVGKGSENRLAYLVWKEELTDFELVFEYRFKTKGNSGVEIRARKDPSGKRPLEGYHADFGHVGIGDGVLGAWDYHFAKRKEPGNPRGTKVVFNEAGEPQPTTKLDNAIQVDEIKRRDWNKVRIVAKGNEGRFFINGKIAAEFVDHTRERPLTKGIVALQLHDKGMEVEFRNVRLRKR